MSSPSHHNLGPAGKSVLKKTQRDSGLFDASMLEMSVVETVVTKKIGRGRGRGREGEEVRKSGNIDVFFVFK